MSLSEFPKSNASVSHVIFDLDGTLLDSEDLYTEAAQQVAGQHGKVFTLELKRRCMGGDARRGAELAVASTRVLLPSDRRTAAHPGRTLAVGDHPLAPPCSTT